MLGNSLPEYVFIRISILLLRLIAPLSILYIAISVYARSWVISPWLGYYALAEALFCLVLYLPRSRTLQKPAIHPERRTREERRALIAKCISAAQGTDLTTGWFQFSQPATIHRDNVVEWLEWALFAPYDAELLDEWREEIDEYVQMVEELMGRKLEYGRDENVQCMKVSIDPVVALHRPLLWYLIVALVDSVASMNLILHGFKHHTLRKWYNHFPPRLLSVACDPSPHSQMPYWHRPHRSQTQYPVVFLHGIGIGLWPYVPFLQEIAEAHPDVGIIAFENLAISMRISPPPLTRSETLSAIRTVLDHHGISKFVLCGHSYGTVVAAHVLHDEELSERVVGWLFVDPIPFLLHLPSVAYNFVYRKPRTASEWQLWYFASRDPDIARALARHFFWLDNVLWKDELEGKRVGVVLSACDQIVDATGVWRYLTEENEPSEYWASDLGWKGSLEVLWYPGLDHAQVFDKAARRAPMLDILSKFMKKPYEQI